jgi:hypothetical protein
MTLPRDRLAYSSPFTRPLLELPGDDRMIVSIVVNVEEWEVRLSRATDCARRSDNGTVLP